MLERVIMIYLAFATVVTAAFFPIPLRTAGAVAREQRSRTEPPPPATPDGVSTPLIGADIPENQCVECDRVAQDRWVELADVEDEQGNDSTADDLVGRDSLARPAPYSSPGEQLAGLAADLAGLPYSWGGVSPATGFDCSGLVYYVHSQFGVTLGRDAAAQYGNGRVVPRGDLLPGDIVFFSDTYVGGISHDGIYLGDGRFVHAVQPGSGVRITSLGDGYWGPRYLGARRVLDA